MAVVVQYIVVRNGVEKMTFATKKEADAHDKMLDIADNLAAFLKASEIKLSDDQNDQISLLLAKERTKVGSILRGVTPSKTPAKKKTDKPASQKTEPKPKAAKKTVDSE
jgi:dsDNA-binding SOS-regulon protein